MMIQIDSKINVCLELTFIVVPGISSWLHISQQVVEAPSLAITTYQIFICLQMANNRSLLNFTWI